MSWELLSSSELSPGVPKGLSLFSSSGMLAVGASIESRTWLNLGKSKVKVEQ